MLPMLLTGALAVQLQDDLGFGPAALGVATGLFTLSRAVTSTRLGRLVDRLGATRSIRGGMIGSVVTLGTMALVGNWWMLVLALCLGGVVQAISQPAVNRYVARSVPVERLGLAFGLKQCGPPLAVILSGVAVPVIALTLGWRWAFGGAAVFALLAYLAIPPPPAASPAPVAPPRSPRGAAGLGRIMFGMIFSVAAINSLHAFVVDAAVEAGLTAGAAGVLLSTSGVVAIVARIGSGIRADRRGGGHFSYAARLLAVGTVAYVLLAMGHPVLYAVGALVAYGSVWGMNGVLFLAIVRHNPDAPAAASGSTIAVGSIGGFCGPPLFGFVVQTLGYTAAWLMAAAWVAIAAGAIATSPAARRDPVPRVG